MPKAKIDASLLPRVAFLDTGVLMRALADREDEDTATCRAFWNAMLAERRHMLASAVTVAELLRKRAVRMPRVKGFAVVGFDERAAWTLGQRLPIETLKEVSTTTGQRLSYLKFDALIVASAIRYDANVLVSLDSDMHKLARRCSVRCARPKEFEDKDQQQLELIEGVSRSKPSA